MTNWFKKYVVPAVIGCLTVLLGVFGIRLKRTKNKLEKAEDRIDDLKAESQKKDKEKLHSDVAKEKETVIANAMVEKKEEEADKLQEVESIETPEDATAAYNALMGAWNQEDR